MRILDPGGNQIMRLRLARIRWPAFCGVIRTAGKDGTEAIQNVGAVNMF